MSLYLFPFLLLDFFIDFLNFFINIYNITVVIIDIYNPSGLIRAVGTSFRRISLIIPPPHAVIVARSVIPKISSLYFIPFKAPEAAKAIVPR